MEEKRASYKVLPFPTERAIVLDSGRLASRRHIIHALLEIDVTLARRLMREQKVKTGAAFSFTAFIVTCLARAVELNKLAHAYRSWRNQLILFDEVDVVTMIEAEVGRVALAHIIRAANRKSLREIHDEIRGVQAQPARSEQKRWLTGWAPRLPAFIRGMFYWGLRQNPHWFKKYAGTVVVTSVGMFGKGGGWGIGFLPMHTTGLTVGGIADKPGVAEGQIEIREYLNLTISFDHDVIDGAPAARFAQCLKELIESGYGLCN
jgi:pyruvate/2-oxoglutarate dehydrogenase complex dihydrolipoamide acyltransferase (E2) component